MRVPGEARLLPRGGEGRRGLRQPPPSTRSDPARIKTARPSPRCREEARPRCGAMRHRGPGTSPCRGRPELPTLRPRRGGAGAFTLPAPRLVERGVRSRNAVDARRRPCASTCLVGRRVRSPSRACHDVLPRFRSPGGRNRSSEPASRRRGVGSGRLRGLRSTCRGAPTGNVSVGTVNRFGVGAPIRRRASGGLDPRGPRMSAPIRHLGRVLNRVGGRSHASRGATSVFGGARRTTSVRCEACA